ncbi:MAG: RidA family protein [Kiritimatiellaeota bacterium]|nr:RidA family protein [Kiritimatiellota bacterium]
MKIDGAQYHGARDCSVLAAARCPDGTETDSSPAAIMERHSSPTVDQVAICRKNIRHYYITAHPTPEGSPSSMFANLAAAVQAAEAQIVSQFVFGGSEMHASGIPEAERNSPQSGWPVTWIHGDGPSGGTWSGTQAYAVSHVDVRPVLLGGRVVGSWSEDSDAAYCLLGDIRPTDATRSPAEQAQQVFEQIVMALQTVGMDFAHVVRTWFYLDKLLAWYDDFNTVRTRWFKEHGVFQRLVPASTGIGVGNPHGTALVADVLTIQPKNNAVEIFAVPSPLQCPALDYQSSFSRAVEVQFPDHRRLYVSGTASIDPQGRTAHIGDVRGQIDLTMRVVEAILESRQMSWQDAIRGIAYFKNIAEAPLFYAYGRERHLPHLPVAVAHSDICRDDLLFEIELDLAVPQGAGA